MLLSAHYPVTASKDDPFYISLSSYCGECKKSYHRIGSIQCQEDSIYVNQIYYTRLNLIVDLIVPVPLIEVYNYKIFRWYDFELGPYDNDTGWIEVSVKRTRKNPQKIEKDCLAIIAKHNDEIREKLYFSK